MSDKLRRAPFEWAIMVVGCTLALICIGLGLTLSLGLPSRTAGANFAGIRGMAPITWWGSAFVFSGLLAVLFQVLYRLRWVAVVHGFAGTMCLYWSLAFLRELPNPNVSATGIWAYLGLGLVHYVVAATMWVAAVGRER